MKRSLLLGVVLMGSFLLAGCGGGSVDANKPIDQVIAEAKNMTVSQLQGIIKSYQSMIEAKKVDIQAIQSKIKQIPLTQLMGPEATKLKEDISKVTTIVSALTERMNAYIKELKAKGGTL